MASAIAASGIGPAGPGRRGGTWRAGSSGAQREVVNPFDQSVVAKVDEATAEGVEVEESVSDDEHPYGPGSHVAPEDGSEPDEIIDEIKKVYSGEIQIGAIIANNIKNEFKKTKTLQNSLLFMITKWSNLTNAEIDIIRLVAKGYSRKEIAAEKHVELSTVKSHINSIMRKMGYSNTKALINDLEHLGIMPYLFEQND